MKSASKFDFYCEEIFTGKTKVKRLYDSDTVVAFHHTKPSYEVHIVIVPKKHIKDLVSVSDNDFTIINEIMKVARDLAKTLDLNQGVRLITNIGRFQDTPHIHFHLVQGEKREPSGG